MDTTTEYRPNINDEAFEAEQFLQRIGAYVLPKLRHKYQGRDAKLLSGQYSGRLGQIRAILWQNGQLLFLVYVYKLDNLGRRTIEFLNSKPDTRSYWPLNKIEIY